MLHRSSSLSHRPGYTLTTKLSVSNALKPIAERAKKKVMDILRALRKIKCTDTGIFLKLFDQQVQPALTYAAEVWGAKKNQEIENVHMYARKKALSHLHHHHHHHHHHLSLNREGRLGTTDDFATSFLHSPLFSTAL